MKQILMAVLVLVTVLVISICLSGAVAVREVSDAIAPSVPTPQPTPGVDSAAAIVREMGTLLERINVGEAVGSGAEANRANTAAVHTSDLGQLVQDITPLIPLCALGIPSLMITVVALGALWYLRQAKDGQEATALIAGMTRLEGIFRAAGVDVPPSDNSTTR